MNEVLAFSPEQFQELLTTLKSPTGLGKAMGVAGLGCGDGGMGSLASGVYDMLKLGSPRLAYAIALGTRLVPYYINIRATFDDLSVVDIPTVGADVKIVQDTLFNDIVYKIINKSTTANDSTFRTQSDYYFNVQSGIEAVFDIQGAPRPSLAPKFTPLANLADGLQNFSGWPKGFILTYQQQPAMSFHASVTLPYVPIEVIVTLRGWTPQNEMFVDMTNKDAFCGLEKCGFIIDECYRDRVCSICR
jgi:hypothetical protein